MIHFNFVHRTYTTPEKRFWMKKLQPPKLTPNCELCGDHREGSFLHMVWDCPDVKMFWSMVANKLSDAIGTHVPVSPKLLLLNDLSGLDLSIKLRRWLLAGLTAAKRMIAQRWKAPHLLPFHQWLNSTVDIANLEMSVARMHGAKETNVKSWLSFIEALQS